MKNETYCWLVLLGVFFLFLPTLLRKIHGDGCCRTEPSEKFRVRPRYDYEKKHVSRHSNICCCCCCRFCCGAPTTDERIHAPVLHDASQIDYCRYEVAPNYHQLLVPGCVPPCLPAGRNCRLAGAGSLCHNKSNMLRQQQQQLADILVQVPPNNCVACCRVAGGGGCAAWIRFFGAAPFSTSKYYFLATAGVTGGLVGYPRAY